MLNMDTMDINAKIHVVILLQNKLLHPNDYYIITSIAMCIYMYIHIQIVDYTHLNDFDTHRAEHKFLLSRHTDSTNQISLSLHHDILRMD